MLSSDKLLVTLRHRKGQVVKAHSPENPGTRYEFRFVSLISPGWSSSFENLTNSYEYDTPKFKRVLLKRSYLVLSWFFYLDSKNLGLVSRTEKSPSVKLAILPSRRKRYTLTKAPMAHKTNSKEQFLFQFFNFKFSVKLRSDPKTLPSGPSQSAQCLALATQLFPTFGTNLLLLKYYKLIFPSLSGPYIRTL